MKKVACIQMDEISTLNFLSDSTIVLGLELIKRGYDLYCYTPNKLFLKDGKPYAKVRKINLNDNEANYYQFLSDEHIFDLVEFDLILVRQDPPFDMNYITSTYMLEMVKDEVLIVNDPSSIRDMPEKLSVVYFREFTPKTLITSDIIEANKFYEEHKDIVAKPLYAFGGKGVFRIKENDQNKDSIFDMMRQLYKEPMVLQQFLPQIEQGDKRIIISGTEIVGAINRVPDVNQVRANLAAGGMAEKTIVSDREKEICKIVGKKLKEKGIIFAGLDFIGEYLTEINITSPTGIRAINRLSNIKCEEIILNNIEDKLKSYGR